MLEKIDTNFLPRRRTDSQTVELEDEKVEIKATTPASRKSTETLPLMSSNRPKEEWNFSNVNPKSPHEK